MRTLICSVASSPAWDDAILIKYLILIQRQLSFQRIVRKRDDTILSALLNKSKQSSIFCSVASSPAGDDAILKIPDSNSPTIKFPAHRPHARRCYTLRILNKSKQSLIFCSVASSPAGDDAILIKHLILFLQQLSFQRIVSKGDDPILFALLNKSKKSSIFCSVASSPAGDDAILKIPDSNSPTIKFSAHRPQARR